MYISPSRLTIQFLSSSLFFSSNSILLEVGMGGPLILLHVRLGTRSKVGMALKRAEGTEVRDVVGLRGTLMVPTASASKNQRPC